MTTAPIDRDGYPVSIWSTRAAVMDEVRHILREMRDRFDAEADAIKAEGGKSEYRASLHLVTLGKAIGIGEALAALPNIAPNGGSR